MSININARSATRASLMVFVALAIAGGCSKVSDDKSVPTNPNLQAQAAQSSIASAKAVHDPQAPGMSPEHGAAAPSASMAMVPPSGDSPPMNMAVPPAGAPMGMARMLGQPPTAGGSSAGGSLPSAMGAPHLYHLGAETFFVDQASAIGLTAEQQKRLTALRETASVAYASTQRKIDQSEQDLWVLTSSELPDGAKIEAKIGEIARFTVQQKIAFIRTIGAAVGVLSDTQRKAIASGGSAAASPSGTSMGAAPPAASGMGVGGGPSKMPMGKMGMDMDKKMPMDMGMGGGGSMPPAAPMPAAPMPAAPMAPGMADAGASGGMGHM